MHLNLDHKLKWLKLFNAKYLKYYVHIFVFKKENNFMYCIMY